MDGGAGSEVRVGEGSEGASLRSLALVCAARVLLQSDYVFLSFNSDTLLLEMCGGDQMRCQRLLNRSGVAHTLMSFLLQPIAGALPDAYGRRPFVLAAPLLIAALRGAVSRPRSGIVSFFVYRQLASLAMLPYVSAMTSMISDVLGRGSDAAVVVNRRTGLVATALQLVLTRLLAFVPHSRYGFRLAAGFSLCSFVLLLLGVRETLPPAKRLQGLFDRKSLVREISPISFLEVFGKTKAMRALAVCTILNMHAGTNLNNGTLLLFRKHKHGWGQAQQSNQMSVAQACGLCEAAVQGPILRRLGLGGALCWGERLGALADVNTVASPDQRTFYLNPLLHALRQSPTVLDRALDAEARLQGISQGRLAAAEENLTFVFRLLMPSVFSELYIRTLERLPGANFLASAACQLVNSEVVAPWAWRQLSQETLDQISSA